MRVLAARGVEALGLDILPGPYTGMVGSIADPSVARAAMAGIDAVLHAATLHKPHVGTHGKAAFVETNVTGTLALLEAALEAGVGAFVFTSTTSTFGDALVPPPGAPAAWIDESVVPVPKNIYGVTKTAAEDLCQLAHRDRGLPVVVLRTSRFFPEADDDPTVRAAFADENLKANEFAYRRVDIEDAVAAHLAALERAPAIGFAKYVISATTPFEPADLARLRTDAPAVMEARLPGFAAIYAARGYRMAPVVDRVYANGRARADLGWRPAWDFARVLRQIEAGEPIGSDLARAVGAKGYHGEVFADGPYPVA